MENDGNLIFKRNQAEFYEINIEHLLNRILRNKKLVGSITLFTVLLSVIIQITNKKTWEGQFQIVLSEQKDSFSGINISPVLDKITSSNIGNLGSLGNSKTSLNTEVGILESPSVLMPIFNYVKKEYIKITPKNKELLFFNWKKNLDISLKKKTSILNISYRDENKDLILPVLDKMSKAFQEYSFRNKLRSNKITKNYISDQIKIYKEKSAASIKRAEQFAMEQDLYIYDKSLVNSQNFLSKKENIAPYKISNTLIETQRVKSANEIRYLNKQIKKIEELKDDQNILQYIVSTISGFDFQNDSPLTKEIEDINKLENLIAEAQTIYQPNTRLIETLKRKRNTLLNLIKERSLGILKAQKLSAESYMQSAMRPEGIILKYKELMRESERDELTLINLENQLRITLLEEARGEDPWELITTPTLLDEYVSPGVSTYAFLGLIGGILLGILYSSYKERKSDIIFESEILKEYFQNQDLIIINFEENYQKNNYGKDILREVIRTKENITFLKTNGINEEDINYLKKISNLDEDGKLINTKLNFKNITDLSEQKNAYLFIVFKMKEITFKEIEVLLNKLKLNKIAIDGLLII